MAIYLWVSFGAILASLFPLWNHVNIHALSIAPIVLMLVSLLQISVFRSYAKPDTTIDNTMYSSREVDQEAYRIGMKYHSLCKLIILPLFFALIFYGSGILKIALAAAVYLLSFLPVKILVRREQKKEND